MPVDAPWRGSRARWRAVAAALLLPWQQLSATLSLLPRRALRRPPRELLPCHGTGLARASWAATATGRRLNGRGRRRAVLDLGSKGGWPNIGDG